MNKIFSQFSGSIPEIYDTCLGPLLFEFSAKDLANRTSQIIPSNSKILEIACGTGISTYHLRETLPETCKIVATDLNDAMLDIARNKLKNHSGISFQSADALSLPFGDLDFDAVLCQFGIMFFPDKPKGLAEMFRVLKPGGNLIFNVWDSLEHNPCAAIAHETICRFFDNDPPQFLKTPFGFFDIDHIQNLMTRAGFINFEVHTVSETAEGISAATIAKGFVEGNPGIIEINERATAESAEVTRAVEKAIENAFGPPPLKIPLQELVFTATKPE
ncbi:MAG: class I SAM-dependent methyltransferase [Nitrospinota bacterium]|nr:class I SAM-dependent methyltransferase [Nitrospinota bacterium]